MFTTKFQAWFRGVALRAAAQLTKSPVTPNQLTITGLVVTTAAASLVALDRPFVGGLVLLFALIFDVLDGALARTSSRSYAYGAFLDSTVDRVSEAVIMVSLLIYFQRHGFGLGPVLVLLAMAGSFLVSYIRARAQSLGFACEGGLMARPERVLLTVAGLLLTPISAAVLPIVVLVLAVFANLTAVQRIWIVWRQSRAATILAASSRAAEASRKRVDDREVRPGPELVG
jgi:CDP-diacylglycerol--glycerol-3-phosphate 3-phosphatidyltransferase